MYSLRTFLEAFSHIFLLALLLAHTTAAQEARSVPASAPAQDIFAAWHATLSDAADRTLAEALADKPWMKVNTGSQLDTSARATTADIDLVVPFRAAVQRVLRLRPTIEPILWQEGVPAELIGIVLVESGGQPTALSPKGARGLWQLMPQTARRYGLVVTPTQDDRIDVEKSTRAAARYLRDLYQQFGDWQLAFAAYNAGEQTVARALIRTRQAGFSEIRNVLPQETRGYVPAVLSSITVLGNNPDGLFPAWRHTQW